MAVSCGELIDGHVGGVRRGAKSFLDRHPAGDDDGADARGDGHFLDVRAVADEEDDALVLMPLKPRAEGFRDHRADHEELLLRLVAQRAGDERAAESW